MPADSNNDSSSAASPFNRTAQHDAKRVAILSQAARLFNSKGSRATTLKDIAESLGLTKTSLYYYVKTKEELIYQCYLATLDHHEAVLDEVYQRYDSPVERASGFLLLQFDSWAKAQQGEAPHVAALLEIASLKGQHRKEVESRYIDMFKRIRQILRDGIADGSMREFEPTSATRAIIGANEWIFSWLHSIPTDEVPDAAREAMDIISRGLYAGKGDFTTSGLSLPQYAETSLPGFDREEQNRLKQEAFYKTGTWYFNKQGFTGTSLDEIAEHLNVSKGAFYYHIKNKEDLLFNCYSRSLDIIEKIHQEVSQSDTNGLQKIAQTCRMIFHVQNSSEGPFIRYNTITALPMDRRLQILQRTDSSNERFGEFMRQGMADGSVRPINVTIAQNLIAGAVNASMDINLWRAVDDLDAAAFDYFDIFFNGLLPRD